MKKLILLIFIFFLSAVAFSQDYEIEPKTKIVELFTTESIKTIEDKVKELRLPVDTVYYDFSVYTTIIIYPKKIAKKEDEK